LVHVDRDYRVLHDCMRIEALVRGFARIVALFFFLFSFRSVCSYCSSLFFFFFVSQLALEEVLMVDF